MSGTEDKTEQQSCLWVDLLIWKLCSETLGYERNTLGFEVRPTTF